MDYQDELQSTFSEDQRSRLKDALNLSSEDEVCAAVEAMAGTLLFYNLALAARNRVPRRTESKKKLLHIAAAARKLRILLSDFDVSRSISDDIEEVDLLPPHVAKVFHRRPLWSVDEVTVYDMLGMLRNIDISATMLACDDKHFSSHYMLPNTNEVNRNFNANTLWPRLFKFWEMAGNKVASTPDGPTFRFLALIHEVAQIDPPEPGALRSACERWQADPARERSEPIPWVA
ncbi:UNVERIFIED_ORG: hypothetical protein J2W74_003401 [Methylorubrum zatmanii]